MKITKIKIENFKSIKEIEFDIKKHGDSYTTMFLGINESGKSNILDAMSYFKKPENEFNYNTLHNQKDEENNPVDLWFSLSFENKKTYVDELKKEISVGENLLDFEIKNIIKNIYLQHGEKNFTEMYNFEIVKVPSSLFLKKIKKNVTVPNGQVTKETLEITKIKDDDTAQELTLELFKENFEEKIQQIIKKYEPSVAYWKPSKEYLISDEDLNEFLKDTNSRVALKNIFLLADYSTDEQIRNVISNVSDGHQRSKLMSKLQDELNKYIEKIWNHDIDTVIDITETGKFTISIKDTGEENKHDRISINGRSEGAKHFLSLILSLSIDTKKEKRKDQLILIDEPEAHLHPSGIRDLRSELLKIGKNNCLFVSTHSPFLVDRKNKKRNIIIKKNSSAYTEKIEIDEHTDIIDDEVLREAFGIEVYRDLLNPHSIIVEGSSDKKILHKALKIKVLDKYSITNGHGSNIDTLASKLNDTGIFVLVILDDDKTGKEYQKKIIRIGGSYSKDNVFTIRDLVGSINDGGTIEDVLGKDFIESKFKEFYKRIFNEAQCDISLDESNPFVEQIKIFLHQKSAKNIENVLEEFKTKISDEFNPTANNFSTKFPLLNSLIEEIDKKIQQN
jgi:predicted ATP-dependent endonuclease of OLD family